MSKKTSRIWHSDYYIVNVQPDGKRRATCRFCLAKTYTENASKMQDHLLQCEHVDEETKSHFRPSKRLRQSKPCSVQQSIASTSLSSVPGASTDGMHITMKADQERLRVLLVDTIALLCKSGLGFKNELKVQGLLGITIDSDDVFIVHINETFPESPAAGIDAEAELVPEPVAELSESYTLSADNAPSPQSGSKFACKRMRMEVQPVKQEMGEWEEDASAWSTMQQNSSKIGVDDQIVISNVFGSETRSNEAMWVDSDISNNSKDRITLDSQPDRSFEAGTELVAFGQSKNDSCGSKESKLYNVPVSMNTSGMTVKVEDEIEGKAGISRKHAYEHLHGSGQYSRTGVPVTVSTASVSPVYNTDDQWQEDEVLSYPIPTAVCWENEDEEQEDYQEMSNWESNSWTPNKTSTRNDDRESQEPIKRSAQNGDREKSFVCQYGDCDKAFYRKDHLTRHQRNKHVRQQ